MSDEVEVIMGPLRGPSWKTSVKDYANMLKAFMGCNYLTIAFAMKQAGLAIGLVGTVIIAGLTAHCCNLIVDIKYHTIQKLMERKRHEDMEQGKELQDPSTACDEAPGELIRDTNYKSEYHKKLVRDLSYEDVGKECFGKWGVFWVIFFIVISQFFFCVGYSIFVGNTTQSMLPLYNCTVPVPNSSLPHPRPMDSPVCIHVKGANSLQTVHLPEFEPEACTHDPAQFFSPTLPYGGTSSFENFTTAFFTTSSIITNMTRAAVTILPITTSGHNVTTSTPPITTPGHNVTTSTPPIITPGHNVTTSTPPITTPGHNVTTTTATPAAITTTWPDLTTSTPFPWSNYTGWFLTRGSHAPDLRLLVLTPTVLFFLMSLIRSLRTLGWISMAANAAILLGCGEVFYFLISGFSMSDTFEWIDLRTLPIFFGMVTSSFEGIGTILHIEGSMEGNRHNFPKYLYGAVAVLASILILFGTLGYLHFGADIAQMVNANIPSGNPLNIFVNVSLIIGVILTYPLMMYPVIDQLEKRLFISGFYCFRKSEPQDTEEVDENQPLLPKSDQTSAMPAGKFDHVPTWQRNLVRLVLVLSGAGLGVLLRNYFAYISAFIGALASTSLAFILPCLFHLKLCWSKLSIAVKVKDVTIIILGVLFSVIGIYSVISEIFG